MTLLTKLEDSEEGLMGITEDQKKVHLGRPMVYTDVYDFGYNDFQKAIGTFSRDFIEKLQKDKIKEYHEFALKHIREDNDAYWFFDTESPASNRLSNYSYVGACLRFEKTKEEAYQREWETKYCQKEIMGDDCYIKLHRAR